MAQLFNKTLCQLREPSSIPKLLELQQAFSIPPLVFTFFPQRMLSGDQLVHDEARSPHIDRLSIALPTRHLLRRLIDECATTLVHALPGLVLHSEAEVNQFDCVISALLPDNYVRWLQISVDVIMPMDVLDAQKNVFHDESAILVLQMPISVSFHQGAESSALGKFHFHD